MITILSVFGGALLGVIVGYFARRILVAKKVGDLEFQVKTKLGDAETRAKEVVFEAKEKAASILVAVQAQEKERTRQIASLESRLMERESLLDKKFLGFEDEKNELKKKEALLREQEAGIKNKEEEVAHALEKMSGLTGAQAKEELLRAVKEENREDLARSLQKMEQERKGEIEKKANEIITIALQRYARTHVSELTTSIFHLSDEELKGKIIGREGRNIRALERATGVEFVIDEIPDAVVISSFDPYRREIARITLDKLVKDGRIQPAKIEESAEEAKKEIEARTVEIGEAAAAEVGVYNLPKEILQFLGRLHFRTSFGQNVLTHSIEMAHISGMMAAELGLDVGVAKKGALVHDLGKAIDHEVEGTHVELGIKLLRKYGIDEKIINAMRSHHDEYPYASPEACVVTAADVLSAARPGARRGTLENYIKRLQDLEKIASEFDGVKQAYAISAGRELRVFVVPEKIDDFRSLELAREIAKKIQAELKYPGEIKVNVIREMRAVEYAR